MSRPTMLAAARHVDAMTRKDFHCRHLFHKVNSLPSPSGAAVAHLWMARLSGFKGIDMPLLL
jgi:hypothetical protein